MEVSTPTPKTTALNGRISEAAMSAHGAVDKAAASAGAAVQSVTPIIDKAAAFGHQAVNKVEDTVKPAERWINEKTDALRAAPRNAAADARQYIVSHPWQSVGLAVLAGVVLGRRAR